MKSLKFLLATALAVNVSSPSVRAESFSSLGSDIAKTLAFVGISSIAYDSYQKWAPKNLKKNVNSVLFKIFKFSPKFFRISVPLGKLYFLGKAENFRVKGDIESAKDAFINVSVLEIFNSFYQGIFKCDLNLRRFFSTFVDISIKATLWRKFSLESSDPKKIMSWPLQIILSVFGLEDLEFIALGIAFGINGGCCCYN